MIRKFLLTTALAAIGFAAPAAAQQCSTVGTQTFCDPTSFHVTDSAATGSDPVLLNEATTFNIDDIDNGATIDKPLTIYFAVPNETVSEGAPSVTSDSFDSGTPNTTGLSLTNLGTWNPATNDLYTFVGCAKCDNSINQGNVDPAEVALGLGTGTAGASTTFTVYSLTVQQGFGGNTDFETVNGLFPLGTLIAPLAVDVVGSKSTFYDTSWTNTGDVNTTAVVAVPEASTWAMTGIGFAFLGVVGLRRKGARFAI